MMKRSLATVVILALITPAMAEEKSELIGTQALPISLFKLSDNKYFRSKDLLGKKNLVVSFFATWCVPCAKEIPKLHEMAAEMKGKDLEFILVDVNEKKDKVAKHIAKKEYTLPVILDKYGKAFENFKGVTLPLLVVINKKGVITYHRTGYKDGEEIELIAHLKTL